MFYEIYDLISSLFYGGTPDIASFEHLIALLFSAIATIFVLSIPFLVVYKVLCLISGGGR